MDRGPLAERIVEAYDGLSAQLQAAARFVLERPRDVALLSMREQARQAGLQPATMTRFAQHLGLEGYDAVRALYADALRGQGPGFADKGGAQVSRQALKGDRALAADMLAAASRQLAALAEPDALERLAAAAKVLAKARRIYVLGQRASYPVAWHLHYTLRLVGRKAHLLDGPGETGTDALAAADREDVLLAVSVEPYARRALDVAALAADRGLGIVALTDSAVSPLARLSRHVVLVSTESPSFLHAMGPAFAAAEVLGALVAGRGGDKALAALRRADAHHAALGTHLAPKSGRKAAAAPDEDR